MREPKLNVSERTKRGRKRKLTNLFKAFDLEDERHRTLIIRELVTDAIEAKWKEKHKCETPFAVVKIVMMCFV